MPPRKDRVFALCEHCGAPMRAPVFKTIPPNALSAFPLGPNCGVMITRRVPGTDEWLTAEYHAPDDDRDDFELVEPLIDLKFAAIALGARTSALYARAASLASSVKPFGSRWRFRTHMLYKVDLPGERTLPTRAEQLAEREHRRAAGEVLRGGAHSSGCLRCHDGPCLKDRRGKRRLRRRTRKRPR